MPARSAGAPKPRSGTRTAVFVVDGAITHDDIPRLCERLRALMDRVEVDTIVCDLRKVAAPDGVTIDALARLQLDARRRGRRIALRNASADLLGLVVLAGLSEAVPLEPGSVLDTPAPCRAERCGLGTEETDDRR